MVLPVTELVYFGSALIGGCMHYMKKRLTKETNVSFNNWFGKSNLPATIYTFIMFCIVIIGTIATGIVTPTMDIWALIYTGFVTGFSIDAGFNTADDIKSSVNKAKIS